MNIKPLPGNMIVKLESLLRDTSGLIAIPDRYKKAPRLVGRIVALNMRDVDRRALGVDLAVGARIIVSPLGGRYVDVDTWVYPITVQRKDERGKKYRDSGVLAIVPDTVELEMHAQAIERCQFCGEAAPGAKQNMLMMRGVCPRCGKDRNGVVPDDSVKLTDEELAACESAR